MRNITIKIDAQTYRGIRAWCAQRDTCVSHVVQAFLTDLPRLENVPRFPLPDAPDPRSLGARINALEVSDIDRIRLNLSGFEIGPPSPLGAVRLCKRSQALDHSSLTHKSTSYSRTAGHS